MCKRTCDKPLRCKLGGGPVEYCHFVKLGGGYGQGHTGTAVYYYCAGCHDESEHYGVGDTEMAKFAECLRPCHKLDDPKVGVEPLGGETP